MTVMFWYQARAHGIDVVDRGSLFATTTPFDSYNYTSVPAKGWAYDRLVPYHSPTVDEDAYVWQTEWDTVSDAIEFRDAYLTVLAGHGAVQVDATTWVVRDGPFADAFRVVWNGRTVTVVNGPTVATLDDFSPGRGGETPTRTPTA